MNLRETEELVALAREKKAGANTLQTFQAEISEKVKCLTMFMSAVKPYIAK